MANPYYVQPATPDITPLLQGFGSFMQQRAQRQRGQEATTAMQEAIASGDARQVAEVSTQYPEYQQSFRDAFGFANQRTEQIAKDTYQRVHMDPDRAVEYLQEGARLVQEAGGNPVMMTQDIQMMQTNPEAGLNKIRMGLAGMFPQQFGGAKGTTKSFAPVTLVNPKTKQKILVAPTYDPNTQTAKLEPYQIPEGFEISRETPEERRSADIAAAGEKETTKTRAGSIEERRQGWVADGFDAAEALPNIYRGIELLDSVETGGIDAASLRARQLFGVEGADEAELSQRLGKAVLSQLRATFGAAFTAQEGQQLERIEAGFGKSTEGNRRLLNQTKRLLERKAKRGIKAARAMEDEETAREIEESMAFRLTPEVETTETVQTPGGAQTTEAVAGPEGAIVREQTVTSQDQQALEWARANPNDPRAQRILQLQGAR